MSVTFARLVTNALLSGLVFALLLGLLVADLNINLEPRLLPILTLGLVLMLSYGFIVSLICLLIAIGYRFLTGKRIRPSFLSPSFLGLSLPLLILVYLVVFRENVIHFLSFFVPGVRALLTAQTMAMFIAAIAGLVLHYLDEHRHSRPAHKILFAGLLGAALILVFVLRLNYPPPQRSYKLGTLEAKTIENKITILSFGGLSLDVILSLTNAGKLQNFSWLMDRGSWGRLTAFTPSNPDILRTSFETGKLPGKHRRISDVRYRIPGVSARFEVAPRFILFRQLTRIGLVEIAPNDVPPAARSLVTIFRDCGIPIVPKDRSFAVSDPAKPNPKTEKAFASHFPDLEADPSWIFAQLKRAFFRDADREEQTFAERTDAPQLTILDLDGVTTAEMYFTKYTVPAAFGEIRQEEIRRYGTVIEKYYQFYDHIISKYLASLKEGELFIVCSLYGMEPVPFWKRAVEWMLGNAAVSADHDQAPDGAVFFFGKGVRRGQNMGAVRIVDLAPTILYYVGLPVGKDMDGVVRASLFEPAFTDENPLFTIASYEDVTIKR